MSGARLVLVATLAHTGRADHRATLRLGNTGPYEWLAGHDLHSVALARFVFGRTPSREMVDAALASNKRCPRETRGHCQQVAGHGRFELPRF